MLLLLIFLNRDDIAITYYLCHQLTFGTNQSVMLDSTSRFPVYNKKKNFLFYYFLVLTILVENVFLTRN